jgi:hypothetical protein
MIMGVSKNFLLTSVGSPICGVIFDPLAEEDIEIGDVGGEGECVHHSYDDTDKQDTHLFHLGACGLILDYLL